LITSEHLCVLCFLLCRPSYVALCLSLVMSELQVMLVVSCCRAHQYAWLLEGHNLSPSALGEPLLLTLVWHCSFLSCTAYCCFALLINRLSCTMVAQLCKPVVQQHSIYCIARVCPYGISLSYSLAYSFDMRSAVNLAASCCSVDVFQ